MLERRALLTLLWSFLVSPLCVSNTWKEDVSMIYTSFWPWSPRTSYVSKIQWPRLPCVMHLRTASETHLLHFLSNIWGMKMSMAHIILSSPLSKAMRKKTVYVFVVWVCVGVCMYNRKRIHVDRFLHLARVGVHKRTGNNDNLESFQICFDSGLLLEQLISITLQTACTWLDLATISYLVSRGAVPRCGSLHNSVVGVLLH